MKVLHIVSSISRTGGGPSRSVQGLVAGLQAEGVEAYLLAIKPLGEPWVDGVKYFRCIGKMKWFGVQKDIECAIDEIKPDLIHIHSIWQLMLHFGAAAARKKGVPYIIAPRGTLEKWSLNQKWLKKKIALLTYQGYDLRHAAALHVTADSEEVQCNNLGFHQYKIKSTNGVNLPKELPIKQKKQGGPRRALFLSRMHKKKGVMELVEAWAKVRSWFRAQGLEFNWICELVYTKSGSEELAYEAKVKARVEELGLSDQFIFTGPLDDDKKWEAYARADLFVLPTYSENFGIVVAEALWAGVPVVTTKGTPWSDLVSNNCGWWIDTGVESLTSTLQQCLVLSAECLEKMGKNGHNLVERKYTWKAVVGAMKHGYEQLLNPCEHAPCDSCRNYGDTCPMR